MQITSPKSLLQGNKRSSVGAPSHKSMYFVYFDVLRLKVLLGEVAGSQDRQAA